MQKASVMQGSGLKLPKEQPSEEVHVFGKNLEERVVNKDEESASISSFNIIAKSSDKDEDNIEAIRERKFDAKTGEEDETTIFQGEFKLFIWDLNSSNWVERGRGQLKLNDSNEGGNEKSRLIMRVSGTLKIILNVAVSSSHFKVIASSKTNIRFSDGLSVWAASGSNANQLRDLIDQRLLTNSKRCHEVAEDEVTPTKRTKSEQDKSPEKKEEEATSSPDEQPNPDSQGEKKEELKTNDESEERLKSVEADEGRKNEKEDEEDEEEEKEKEETGNSQEKVEKDDINQDESKDRSDSQNHSEQQSTNESEEKD